MIMPARVTGGDMTLGAPGMGWRVAEGAGRWVVDVRCGNAIKGVDVLSRSMVDRAESALREWVGSEASEAVDAAFAALREEWAA